MVSSARVVCGVTSALEARDPLTDLGADVFDTYVLFDGFSISAKIASQLGGRFPGSFYNIFITKDASKSGIFLSTPSSEGTSSVTWAVLISKSDSVPDVSFSPNGGRPVNTS